MNLVYNPDTLITSKEEEMELPQSPAFYEDPMDAIFRMFQENGTGNPPYAPIDQTTAVRQPEPIKPKLCPFRKHIHFKNDKDAYDIALNFANHMEEEFLPCVKSECMFYNAYAPGGPCCTK